jgi:hypothetical protein
MLYFMPAPVGAVTVIVPVGDTQVVGWLKVTVGAASVPGALIVTNVTEEVHNKSALLDVTGYMPGGKSVNTPEVLV